MTHVHVWDQLPLELDVPLSSFEFYRVNCACGDTKIMSREELEIPEEDPAEEYFRILEMMPEFQYLRQKAQERYERENPTTKGGLRKWLNHIFHK